MPSPIFTLDVAHPPRNPGQVELELLDGLTRVRNSPAFRVLKVIHGYGSSGKGGSTRDVVRNWAFRQRTRLKGVIEGERYTHLDAVTQELLKDVQDLKDVDLNTPNPGITVLWVK